MDFVLGQFRVNRKCQSLFCRLHTNGECLGVVSKVFEAGLHMEWKRVIDFAAYTMQVQMFFEGVPSVAYCDHELIVNMTSFSLQRQENLIEPFFLKQPSIERCIFLSSLSPFIQVLKLHDQYGRLQGI